MFLWYFVHIWRTNHLNKNSLRIHYRAIFLKHIYSWGYVLMFYDRHSPLIAKKCLLIKVLFKYHVAKPLRTRSFLNCSVNAWLLLPRCSVNRINPGQKVDGQKVDWQNVDGREVDKTSMDKRSNYARRQKVHMNIFKSCYKSKKWSLLLSYKCK